MGLEAGRTPAEWSAERLAGELRIERSGAEQHLVALAARRLLALHQGEGVDRYRYAPGTEELDRAVDALASSYEKRRVSVIHVLYSKPNASIRVFADAFRLRLCFVGLALNNGLVLADLVAFPDIDFSLSRSLTALGATGLLVFGLVWDAE